MRLSTLLESVQEELLSLYEADSNRLADQIRHWELVRKENAILNAARQQGIRRLGMHMVPTLASSESKARQAIEMQMYLQSLQRSPFGEEDWNLQQTTRERFMAPPEYCFKKGGQPVDAIYDKQQDNNVRYTAWEDIYYQSNEDVWHKVLGQIDHKGLFYTQVDGLRVPYVDFESEAAIYSHTGTWEVYANNKPILPDTSSSLARQPARRTSHSPKASYKKKGTASNGVRGRRSGLHHPGGRGRRPRERGPQPPSPDQVGASRQTVARRSSGRLGRLLAEAADPPALLLKGSPNILKCFRFKCKRQHSSLFSLFSTTFQWTASEGPARVGNARVIITFVSVSQRQTFMSRVRIPESITSVPFDMGAV